MTRFLQALKDYNHPGLLRLFFLGFASGLPLPLTLSNLTFWLTEEKISMSQVGLFAIVGVPYTLKFLWSHAVDHLPIPPFTTLLGKRRGWILFAQILLMGAIAGLALTSPKENLGMVAVLAFLVATASATQDIAIDAFRIESLPKELQGHAAAIAVFGYRVAMLVASAGGLLVAQYYHWSTAYLMAALLMVVGMVAILFSKEPSVPERISTVNKITMPVRLGLGVVSMVLVLAIHELYDMGAIINPHYSLRLARAIFTGISFFLIISLMITVLTGKSMRESTVAPFVSFAKQPYWWLALIFILFFKFGDAFAGIMTSPFLVKMGFSKAEVAMVVKTFGFAATIAGAVLGGILTETWGTMRALWVSGILQMLSNLLFCLQAYAGHSLALLFVTIGVENFTGSMATAAFVSYVSALCLKRYSATQYALLSSIASFSRTILVTGIFLIDSFFFPDSSFIDVIGWSWFFAITAAGAIPGLLLLFFLKNKLRAT
ncbi:MAG: MFS transporter [Alphaproteobacteria bacterium]|nr:MFS transporter [Alphaproteobacteria bacterium]